MSWREFRRAASSRHSDPSTLASAHAYFLTAGATLAVVTLLLPHEESMSDLGILACAGGSLALAVVMILGYQRVPWWGFVAVQSTSTVLITMAIYASGASTGPYSMMYVWIGVYAALLLGTRWTVFQIAFIGLAFGAVLLVDPEPGALENWVVRMGTIAVVAFMVLGLKERLDGLIAELETASRTDALTGLLNRRGFDALLERERERSRRTGATLSLLVGDLDEFKAVNDRFGHAAGDRALEKLSRVVEASKRRIDVAARLGGEEFGVLAPETDERDAYVLAERLREAVREAFAGDPVPLTISFGVASLKRGEDGDLVEAADRALYAAKESGRDRSEVSDSPPWAAV